MMACPYTGISQRNPPGQNHPSIFVDEDRRILLIISLTIFNFDIIVLTIISDDLRKLNMTLSLFSIPFTIT